MIENRTIRLYRVSFEFFVTCLVPICLEKYTDREKEVKRGHVCSYELFFCNSVVKKLMEY